MLSYSPDRTIGQRDQAQHLLREALAQGQPYGLWLHTDPDLEAPRP
jgi:hypothetical protein